MLSLFPNFFEWSWYVPFFFRLFCGYYFLTAGLRGMHEQNVTGKITGGGLSLMGILFLMGIFTQLLGLITIVFSMFSSSAKKNPKITPEPRMFFLLLAVVGFSFLFLGAGPYAIDLPL